MIPRELKQLADICGVLTAYEDVYKKRHEASVDSLLAVFSTLGARVSSLDDVPRALAAQRTAQLQRGLEPVIVTWDGQPAEFDLSLPAQDAAGSVNCVVELEDQSGKVTQQSNLDKASRKTSLCGRFVTFRLMLPPALKWGYHPLTVETSGGTYRSLIISAPRRAYAEEPPQREWGCFLPLYALRSERNWGAGDFTDLQNLATWTADLGGKVVGTLPLLAAFLDQPCEPSPYAPASRLAWNEFYIDVSRVAELAQAPAAVELMQSADFVAEVARLRKSELVEYRNQMALKRRVLEMLSDVFFNERPEERFTHFLRFLPEHPHVEDYARFRAAYEQQRVPWRDWPSAMRDGSLTDSDYDRRSKQYHLYVQWIAHEQLQALASVGGGLYLDLPLGVRSDGYDVWRWKESYAMCASAGAPPDAVWTRGQDWCFPPLLPEAIRRQGYVHVRDYLRHHLQLTRLLRIDHVMQLHRLYWIPQGLPADQGVYVKYRPDEFYAILALESHRYQAALVGENLGTVPPQVNHAMDRHNFQRMYVVQYEVADDGDKGGPALDKAVVSDASRPGSVILEDVPRGAMASLNTHDMPTFAAWWQGKDISFRQHLDLLSEQDARREQEHLDSTRAQLTAFLSREGWLAGSESGDQEILLAVLRFLSASCAGVVLVNLEDLWLETQPQNLPGTGPELPNWKRKAAFTLDEVMRSPEVLGVLQEVAQFRE